MNEIRKEILKKFIYNDKLKYNEIWNKKKSSSSLFDYHLKKLIDEGIIKKNNTNNNNNIYELTNKGLKLTTNLDGKKIEISQKPVVCSFFIVEKNGKYLLSVRNKQPFINFLGIAGGKVDFGLNTKEQAEKELFEETNLTGNCELKIIGEFITQDVDNKEIKHHIIGFFYLFKDVVGELKPETREGDFLWLGLDEIKNYDTFPEVEENITIATTSKNLVHYVKQRKMKNNKFI